ncbi:hypothetical protein [Variovorax sp. HJSM1_2]|uniref:hypothetical protein n=1 Tax=Variovorax sp. HJSM1_2 TaxID=3366263 RepID=UPI003BEDFB0B
MFSTEKVTKLDAAERLLSEAINLFFEQRNMIAVHALASAAFQVLADLGARQGFVNCLRDNVMICADRRKEWVELLNRAQNFFKHADRDPHSQLEFSPNLTPLFISEAIHLQYKISGNQPKTSTTFQMWFISAYADLLNDSAKSTVMQTPALRNLAEQGNAFKGNFELYLELLRE